MNKEKATSIQPISTVMLVRPANFSFDAETAKDNHFQHNMPMDPEELHKTVLSEWENFYSLLTSKGINVVVFDDTLEPSKPDAIYCRDWNSFHPDGTVILYPMKAKVRRTERRRELVESLPEKHGFKIERIIDLSEYEKEEKYLEGSGAVVFDYANKVLYSVLSARTHPELIAKVGEILGFEVVTFNSADSEGYPIYHVDVVLSVGEKWAIFCEESVQDEKEKAKVKESLEKGGHEVILADLEQMTHLVCNCYEAVNDKNERFIIMSENGVKALKEDQRKTLEKYAEIVPIPVYMIEFFGGGSVRCMSGDIKLPKKEVN